MILGILVQIFSGLQDIGDPLPGLQYCCQPVFHLEALFSHNIFCVSNFFSGFHGI